MQTQDHHAADIRAAMGLRPVINVSGTMTGLGASIVVPEAVRAVADILPQFVEVNDLQRKASAAIARACGSEAGFVTASAAAGITLSIAGCMTGADLARIERLPDAAGLRHEVAVQTGHLVGYGAPIDQSIRLAGARVVAVGQATEARPYQLAGVLGPQTAAVLYVVSHHTVQTGQLTLEEVVEAAQAQNVPVIVDAASEYDLRGFLARGADIAVYSAHKFLGGPTAGIVAGRKDLVRAAFLQNMGIGRGMKVGKEGVAGAIAALDAWAQRDHAAVRAREMAHLKLWQQRLARWPGVSTRIIPDTTANPLDRLEVAIDPAQARTTAWDLADALAAGSPPVIVRDHELELGLFVLDPCNLHPGQDQQVAARLDEELERARGANALALTPSPRRNRFDALLRWPD